MRRRTPAQRRAFSLRAAALMSLLVLWAPLCSPQRAAHAGADGTPAAAGWEEDASGDFAPPAGKTVRATQGSLEAQFVLPPGRRATWEKSGEWQVRSGDNTVVGLSCDRGNLSSNDYRKGKARFPAWAAFVFGKDTVDRPAGKKRAWSFRRWLLGAFRSRGIRIVYACGSGVPAGSMYRLGDEVTVFILADAAEGGRAPASPRDLAEDFRAAYGRLPRGPVTKVSAGADRPSSEDGPLTGSVSVVLPQARPAGGG